MKLHPNAKLLADWHVPPLSGDALDTFNKITARLIEQHKNMLVKFEANGGSGISSYDPSLGLWGLREAQFLGEAAAYAGLYRHIRDAATYEEATRRFVAPRTEGE